MSQDHASTSHAGGCAGDGKPETSSSPSHAPQPGAAPHGPPTGHPPYHDPWHLGPHGTPFGAPQGAPPYGAPYGAPHGIPYGAPNYGYGPAPGYPPAPHGPMPQGPYGGPTIGWVGQGGWGMPLPGWSGSGGPHGGGAEHGTSAGAAAPSGHGPASFNWTSGWLDIRNEAYVKGLVVGALGAVLLSNDDVQKKAMQSVAGLWSLLQGGVEEIKERFADVEAEMNAASRQTATTEDTPATDREG